MEEDLINKHKVCNVCGKFSGPGIIECPNPSCCHSQDFRPLTDEEANGPAREVYTLVGHPLLPPSTREGKITTPLPNAFVL